VCSAISGAEKPVVGPGPGPVYDGGAVRFNDDGRPLFTAHQQPVRNNMLFWRRNRDLADRKYATPVDTFQYRPYSRTVMPVPGRSRLARAAPYVTRRVDAPSAFDTATGVTTMKREMIVVEEMKVYDEKPWGWWMFIILAILMFVLGVLNVLWCWECHWYSRFWTALLVRTVA